MSVVVVTTISCDASILKCERCQSEIVSAAAVSDIGCRTCGDTMHFDRRCEEAFSLHRDAILIRAIAENKKDGNWHCEQRGGRDFCPTHVHLACPDRAARITQPPPHAVDAVRDS